MIGGFLTTRDRILGGIAFSLVEAPVERLLAARREAFVLREPELLLQLAHPHTQFLVTRFERSDVGLRSGGQLREVVFVHNPQRNKVRTPIGLRSFVTMLGPQLA